MDLKLVTRKLKRILTSLHHYIFIETDTLFLEWLTFRRMGKWCVTRFKLHFGCNQDSCLIYGFLPCPLFSGASRCFIKEQQKLREEEVMFYKFINNNCSLLLYDRQHNLVLRFKIGGIFHFLVCRSGNQKLSTFKTFYSQFCIKNLTITVVKKASESFCSPSAWIP